MYANHQMNEVPPIDTDHILSFIRVGGTRDPRGRHPQKVAFEQELNDFYDHEFQPCFNQPKYDLTHKSFLLPYLATQIQTGFNNNTKEHFLTRIRKIMNLLRPTELTDDTLFKRIETHILQDRHDLIPDPYRAWAQMIRQEYLPPTYEKCYGYDVKAHPDKYLSYSIKMNDVIEQYNQVIQHSQLPEEEQRKQIHKLFQPIPLRTNCVPCYLTLDAASIVSIFYQHNKAIGQHISEHQEAIWSSLFLTNKKVMRIAGYHFSTLQTDGVGVSICFQKNGLTQAEKKISVEATEPKHLEDLNQQELALCQGRHLVAGDPGKQSAIYLMNDQRDKLRYTPRQRQAESRTLICQHIMDKEKTHHGIQALELVLSHYDSKTVNYQLFKEYLSIHTHFQPQIGGFYQQIVWRRMKWRTWINRRQSEDQFLNRMEQTFGSRDDVLICYGDWSQTQQMKYLMPSQGVGLRRLIQKRFDVVMVDEFRTSKLCNQCHGELGHYENLYRVLVCQNCQYNRLESKCCIFNRDANACMNLLYLSHEWIQHQSRPEPYCRMMTLTTFTPDVPVGVRNLRL